MELRHLINEELYTNSLLISPITDEQSIIKFHWVKKNSKFSNMKEKRVINSSHQLYYQCTIFDYLSTIQLVILDKKGRKNIYVFGPIQLQSDLYPYLKIRQLNYNIKIIFNRKQAISTTTKIHQIQKGLALNFQFDNGIDFTLHYPKYNKQIDYQGLFKIQQIQGNQFHLSFSKQKRIMVQIFKKLKIYSYQGNFLKLVLKNQMQRDIFLINFLTQTGFIFQPQKKKYFLRNITPKVSQMKTQSSRNKQISGSYQLAQINIHHPKQNTSNDLCDICNSSPNSPKSQMKQIKQFAQKLQIQLSNIDHKQTLTPNNQSENSFEFQFFDIKNKKKNIQNNTEPPLNFKDTIPYKNKRPNQLLFTSPKKKANISKKHTNVTPNQQQNKMKKFIRQNRKLQENNKILAQQNKQLKAKMNQITLKKKQQRVRCSDVPLFIKEIQIQKSIKKLNQQLNQKLHYKLRDKSSSKSNEKANFTKKYNNHSIKKYKSNNNSSSLSKQKNLQRDIFPVYEKPQPLFNMKSFSFFPKPHIEKINRVNVSKQSKKIKNYGTPLNTVN